MKPINKFVTETYLPTTSNFPIWREKTRIVIRYYEFDTNSELAKKYGKPTLVWKYDPDDKAVHPMFHGCSYRWSGYNPTPCTEWFHGIPLHQMIDWCEEHGLTNPKLLSEHVNITWHDISYENIHPDF